MQHEPRNPSASEPGQRFGRFGRPIKQGAKKIVADTLRMFSSVDLLVVTFALLMSLIALIGSARVHEWGWVLSACLFSAIVVTAMNLLRVYNKSKWVDLLHLFYVAPVVPIFFKLTDSLSFVLHGCDYDDSLILVDRALFHTDPTVWLFHHLPPQEWFVGYLQVCYSLFYFLPVILAVELYMRHTHESFEHQYGGKPTDQLGELRFVIVYGFFLSYLGYIAYPAIGPRFTLHDFASLSRELPGGAITEFLRNTLNAGENIDPHASLETVRRIVTRDAFPSGHTEMTFLTMLLAFKYRARTRWLLFVIGTSLIFATVYLRYHYVIDLIGGVLFGVVALYSWPLIERWLRRMREWILGFG